MVRLPKYKAPFDTNFKEYNDVLKVFNITYQNRIGSVFRELFAVNKDFSILTTGSDGRFEKGPVSEIELIILYNNHAKEHNYNKYIEHIIEISNIHHDGFIEFKNLEEDVMSKYENKSDRTFPSRIADSTYLFGQRRLHYEAKEKLLKEFRGSQGKSIMERVKSRRKEFEKALLTGIQKFNKDNIIQHYDLTEGVSFYNSKNKQYSFKTGPLRLVQYGLMQNIIKYSRAVDFDSAKFLLRNAPTNTAEKLFFFEAEGISNLSSDETIDLARSYEYFLWAYTAAQENFEFNNEVRMQFDEREVTERLKAIDKIMKKDILKIQNR